ncbi:type I polyketide synthase [candidate division KSB1 bacterium]|nr:type I polyketide synthase [candidate division KSB1 bacterium]
MTNKEPIAIVGIGCRFPGGIHNPQDFWDLLCNGIDAVTEIPKDRWDIDVYFDPDPNQPGKMSVRHGAFLQDITGFDADFFHISPREAAHMDPQQRVLLEVTWEAFEDAGILPQNLAGTAGAVYIGAFTLDYKLLFTNEHQRPLIDYHTSTGVAATLLSNRISHWFDFTGPSLTVDTACSSSLVAVHLACHSLWAGDSDFALAGGVNLIFNPEWTIATSKGGYLSPDGRCKAFDARANGYVRGEGAGIVLLEPLSTALNNQRHIYATIRATGINQDGFTSAISVPNEQAQRTLLEHVYADADISPAAVEYVEAHGTGTAVGDPIEARAIGAVLARNRPDSEKCLIGSIKTNIGHTEAAAGIAGLIKAALCLYHSNVPPSLHFETPNPAINFETLKLCVPTKMTPLSKNRTTHYAAVNSFGFGGTNAHVVLQSHDHSTITGQTSLSIRSKQEHLFVLPLSAQNKTALKDLVRSCIALINEQGQYDLDEESQLLWSYELGANAALRRSMLPFRVAFTATSQRTLVGTMQKFLDEHIEPGVFYGTAATAGDPKIVFVYNGVGSEYVDMGRELCESHPVFRQSLQKCCRAFDKYLSYSLFAVLAGEREAHLFDNTQITQMALFSIQVALTELWSFFGIHPDAVVGHSLGEIAAAWATRALSLDDAAFIVYHRSRLQEKLSGQGGMLAVGLGATAIQEMFPDIRDHISIAAENGPHSVTLSGDKSTLLHIESALTQRELFCRALPGHIPYHSPAMEPLMDELGRALESLAPTSSRIPFYSTVHADVVDGARLDRFYWLRNIREPVQFYQTVRRLCDQFSLFLEIGPHPVLSRFIEETLFELKKSGHTIASMRRGESNVQTISRSLADLFCRGTPILWDNVYVERPRYMRLPTYPWQRKNFWTESYTGRASRIGERQDDQKSDEQAYPHLCLGRRLRTAQPTWELVINRTTQPFVFDHVIQNRLIYPGAAYICAALEAIYELGIEKKDCVLQDIELPRSLVLSPVKPTILQTTVIPLVKSFEIHSLDQENNDHWLCHTKGKYDTEPDEPAAPVSLTTWEQHCAHNIEHDKIYAKFREIGFVYGAQFRSLESLSYGEETALAQLRLPNMLSDNQQALIHPVLLDACFQTFLGCYILSEPNRDGSLFVPTHIDRLKLFDISLNAVWCCVRITSKTPINVSGDLILCDGQGKKIAEMIGLLCKRLVLDDAEFKQGRLYHAVWEKAVLKQAPPARIDSHRPWLIFVDEQGCGRMTAERLSSKNIKSIIVTQGPAFRSIEKYHYQVPPGQLAAMEKLAATIAQSFGTLGNVLYFWGLDAASNTSITTTSLDMARNLCFESVRHLVVTLNNSNCRFEHLWFFSNSCWPVTESETCLSITQAPLWGLGRVVENEYPQPGCTMVDIGSPSDLAAAIDEILAYHPEKMIENEIAFRKGTRYVRRLYYENKSEQALATGRHVNHFQETATYLVVGGTKGFGLYVAEWMVKNGARSVVLLGRNKPPLESHAVISRMRASGARISMFQGDVTVSDDVSALMRTIKETMPPLKGVIQAAAVYDDALLSDLTAEQVKRVFLPKVDGSWNLLHHTQQLHLDFFVLFSSIAWILGNPGQAHYSAANAFLEALAGQRAAQGKPVLCIHWGPISHVGQLAKNAGIEKNLKDRGIRPLSLEYALNRLSELLASKKNNSIVADIDWHTWARSHITLPARFIEIAHTTGPTLKDQMSIPADVPHEEQKALVKRRLVKAIAQIAGIVEPETLDENRDFNSMGFDSMMLLELRNYIHSHLVYLSFPDIFQYSTIKTLTEHILQELSMTNRKTHSHELDMQKFPGAQRIEGTI